MDCKGHQAWGFQQQLKGWITAGIFRVFVVTCMIEQY
jgi:hypothetical protein